MGCHKYCVSYAEVFFYVALFSVDSLQYKLIFSLKVNHIYLMDEEEAGKVNNKVELSLVTSNTKLNLVISDPEPSLSISKPELILVISDP